LIHSKTLHHEPVTFIRAEDNIIVSDTDAAEQLKYITQAIEVFEQYAKSFNIPMRPFNITIDSNLDDAKDRKSTRLNSSHVSISYNSTLSLHDALPIFNTFQNLAS